MTNSTQIDLNHTPYAGTLHALIETQLRHADSAQCHVSPHSLVQAIRKHPDLPLPPLMRQYVCDMLEGKMTPQRGRKKHLLIGERDALLTAQYHRYHAWLTKRFKTQRRGWAAIKDADWWQGDMPSEIAAKMAARSLKGSLYYPMCDWRTVLNIVSSQK